MRSRLRPAGVSRAIKARSSPLSSGSMRASTRAEIPRARALGMARKGRRATTLGRVASPPASNGHHGAVSDSIGAGTMPMVVGPLRTAASTWAGVSLATKGIWQPK
jgi:hypothetical protein